MIKVNNEVKCSFPLFHFTNFLLYKTRACLSIEFFYSCLNNKTLISSIYSFLIQKKRYYKAGKNTVKKSTRKLYAQKGTGRARRGSGKSVIMRGGRRLFINGNKAEEKKYLKKRCKFIFLCILLNKRSTVMVVLSCFHVHSFCGIKKYLEVQLNIIGLNKKEICCLYNNKMNRDTLSTFLLSMQNKCLIILI